MKKRKLTIEYTKDESGWWVAQAKEEPGILTQGRTVKEAARRIVEAAAAFYGEEEARPIEVVSLIVEPPSLKKEVRRARDLRAKAAKLDAAAKEATRELVARAKAEGFSLQETADFIGVTRARIQQLAKH